MTHPDHDPRDYRNAPTYWFAILEIARERGNFERAAEAQRHLRRLGVVVSYGAPRERAATSTKR